jgi:GSCFA family protein
MTSPYSNLNERAYWRSGVGNRSPLDPGDVYQPKFPITREMRIVTAGSCFAQHVGNALKSASFNVVDAEPFPEFLSDSLAQRYGYRLYSARYGNIYTARQLMQIVNEMRGKFRPAEPVWHKDGRYFDALRPNVEPLGLDSHDSVMKHRKLHLAKVKSAFFNCDLMVFTFGLTEAWVHQETGTTYPTAPGTIAGQFDPKIFSFKNFDYEEILRDFNNFAGLMRKRNPGVKFLITTSPVPLTATASDRHVEVATCYSKSVLRAVCGKLYDTNEDIDYFPSFEIITSTNNRGAFFENNKRNVSDLGVNAAMDTFLKAHDYNRNYPSQRESGDNASNPSTNKPGKFEEICEEALLEAFSS